MIVLARGSKEGQKGVQNGVKVGQRGCYFMVRTNDIIVLDYKPHDPLLTFLGKNENVGV